MLTYVTANQVFGRRKHTLVSRLEACFYWYLKRSIMFSEGGRRFRQQDDEGEVRCGWVVVSVDGIFDGKL
jgi:hypothetical protein